MRIALLGIGHWGKNIARELNKLNVLSVICDSNENLLLKIADDYPDTIITSEFETCVLNKNIDAVCIALPTHLHYEYAKQCLLSNKNVFVEKPITLNVEEAEELANLAKQLKKILMVGHILQYHPCINEIKCRIAKNEIGNIKYITSNRFNLGKFRTEENVLWSFAPHDISVILSLCKGMPNKISCNGKSVISENVHDITNTTLYFDDIYVNINVSWLNPFKEQKMTIVGDKGMIVFDDTRLENKVVLYKDYIQYDGNKSPTVKPTSGIPFLINMDKSPLELELSHFIDCCQTRSTPLTDGTEGINVLKVLQLSNQSLIEGKPIVLNKNWFKHDTAIIDSNVQIGEKTKIWHFTHISNNAKIGRNCVLGQNVYVGNDVIIGNNVKIQNNVSVYTGVTIEDDVFLGPSCVFTNDKTPNAVRSKNGQYMKTLVKKGATIGANATIICGTVIGQNAFVGAGAVVTRDVENNAIVVGNPAHKISK